ncbi:MAG: GNAT family N-acetyltransferase [Chloroflexota bacterium]|nr:GNAT family N-acetyltransferase [Chloroflexota bacterium]
MIEHDPRHNPSVEIEARPFEGDHRAFLESVAVGFSEHLDEEQMPKLESILEFDRAIGAYDGDRLVGNAAAISFELTIPGGVLPAAGITTVGVHPTHRRRGALREMMRLQLDDVHRRGEPVAVLWASEGGIYQRFGYGLGSLRAGVKVDRHRNAFRQRHSFSGRIVLVGEDEARKAFPPVYDAVRPTRPGFFSFSPAFWDAEVFYFPERWRRGRGEPFHVLHDVAGVVDGYARYAVRGGDSPELSILDMAAATPAAHLDLWRYLLDIDLMARLEWWNLAVDDPLLLAVAEPRRLEMSVGDALWLRIADLSPALAARRYRADGRVVLEVADEFCPWNDGRWGLTVEDGVPYVEPATEAADLVCDVTDLAAAYLGGFSFAQLAAAARAEERAPGGIARADALFRTDRAPWCPRVF